LGELFGKEARRLFHDVSPVSGLIEAGYSASSAAGRRLRSDALQPKRNWREQFEKEARRLFYDVSPVEFLFG
jgi:hypothetical protein